MKFYLGLQVPLAGCKLDEIARSAADHRLVQFAAFASDRQSKPLDEHALEFALQSLVQVDLADRRDPAQLVPGSNDFSEQSTSRISRNLASPKSRRMRTNASRTTVFCWVCIT